MNARMDRTPQNTKWTFKKGVSILAMRITKIAESAEFLGMQDAQS